MAVLSIRLGCLATGSLTHLQIDGEHYTLTLHCAPLHSFDDKTTTLTGMTPRVSTVFGFLAVILPFVTASHWGKRHQEVAHRARGDVDIHKRQSYTNARFTFYDVGL